MNSNIVAAVLGLALIAGASLYFVTLNADAEPAERTSRTPVNTEFERQVETLRKENSDLRKHIAELERATPEAAPEPEPEKKDEEPTGELTDEEIGKGLKRFGSRLQRIIRGKGKEAVEELRELIKRGGPKVLKQVTKAWLDASIDLQRRVIAAHILAQSGDPAALELLSSTLRDPDQGMIEHRIAAHALAFSDAEGLEPLLLEVARNHKETGASANAAFGLARRGIEEGIELYMAATDQAFEEGQPEAIQYLSGLPLIGEKAKPYVRERLLTYKSETALLTLIEIVKALKDEKAIEQLQELAYDASRPVSIQKAAKGAIEALTKTAPDK